MAIELPKDAEGREIPLDTEVLYDEYGNAREIAQYIYRVHQKIAPSHIWDAKMLDGRVCYPSNLYLTPPDSWKRLEEDLSDAGDARYYEACAYFHRDKDEGGCESCPGGEDGCGRIAMRDILNRIRKLRGED